MRQHGWVFAALILLALTGKAQAQLEPVGVPRGTIRFEFSGEFENYDHRFRDGNVEDWAADFSRPALGSDFWPELRLADTLVAGMIGNPGYRINLGRSSASAEVNLGTGTVGLALGLTSGLTLLANIPFVRSRVQPRFLLDSTNADATVNPNNAAIFLGNFQAAIDQLAANIQNGVYSGPQLATANAALASATQLRGRFAVLTGSSPFLPTISSSTGQAIAARVHGVQDTLHTLLGIPSNVFADTAALPDGRIAEQGFNDFLTQPGFVFGFPIEEALLTRVGDIEVGAVYTLIDHWDRGRHQGGFRMALSGTVTLPTGQPDLQNNFFDIGTGTGHNEVRVGITTDLGGGRWGARLAAGYNLRLRAFRVRRVSPPDQPIAFEDRLANLELNPGDIASVTVRPFFRLAPTLALQAGVQYWRRSQDQVTYASAADSILGVPANVLAQDTEADATILSGGITYSSSRIQEGRRRGLPVEASWTYSGVVASTQGRVAQSRTMRMMIRFYYRLWR